MIEPPPPDPHYPRLTDRPLPAYRFNGPPQPHPTRHPAGHSYGLAVADGAADADALARGVWQESGGYCYAVDLYNYAYWWEAHETWEGVWQCYAPDDALRHGLQVMIQVSVVHLLRHRGTADAARRLLARAEWHLQHSGPAKARIGGVDLATWFSSAVRPYFAGRLQRYPFLRPLA
jgi:hypothetical protein